MSRSELHYRTAEPIERCAECGRHYATVSYLPEGARRPEMICRACHLAADGPTMYSVGGWLIIALECGDACCNGADHENGGVAEVTVEVSDRSVPVYLIICAECGDEVLDSGVWDSLHERAVEYVQRRLNAERLLAKDIAAGVS